MLANVQINDPPPHNDHEEPQDVKPVHSRLPKKLTPHEVGLLKRCEREVERGMRSFNEAGKALAIIRNQRLYREQFATFRAYCRARWGFQASRARQLIAAAEVFHDLEGVTNVAPTEERQLRPLVSLDVEQRREAWGKAVERSIRPTTEIVREVVADLTGTAPEPPTPEVKLADTIALIEHMIVMLEVLIRTVRGWNYKVGLDSAQKEELRKLLKNGYNAMRDVSARLL